MLNALSAAAGTLFVAGNFDVTTLTANSGTIAFDGNAAQTVTSNAQSFFNITVSNKLLLPHLKSVQRNPSPWEATWP